MVFAFLSLYFAKPEIPVQWACLVETGVQRDLHLSPAQVRQIGRIMGAAESRLAREQREHPRFEARAISHSGLVMELAVKDLQAFGKSLSPSQRLRAREISIRQFWPVTLNYPGISEDLGLSLHRVSDILRVVGAKQQACLKRVNDYAHRHHVPFEMLKGGMKVPESTPEILRLRSQFDAEIRKVMERQLSDGQLRRLRGLEGPAMSQILRH